jgi:hypothetical protein
MLRPRLLKWNPAGARKSPPGGLFRPSRDHMQAAGERSAQLQAEDLFRGKTAGSGRTRKFP